MKLNKETLKNLEENVDGMVGKHIFNEVWRDVVISLINEIRQLSLHNVSQQRELLLAYNEEINQCMVDSQDILEESDIDEFLANYSG